MDVLFRVGFGAERGFSALAVIEQGAMLQRVNYTDWRKESRGEKPPLVVRHLERMRLGTPYLEVARRVADVARSGALQGPRRLVIDATGIGAPVVEMVKAARPGCEVSPAAAVVSRILCKRFSRSAREHDRVLKSHGG